MKPFPSDLPEAEQMYKIIGILKHVFVLKMLLVYSLHDGEYFKDL